METLRLKVRDAVQNYLERSKKVTINDIVDVTCDLADIVFDALDISEKQQDSEGAKVEIKNSDNL